MANKEERFLRIPRTGSAECSMCGHKFTGTILEEVLQRFREHNCIEDASQHPRESPKE